MMALAAIGLASEKDQFHDSSWSTTSGAARVVVQSLIVVVAIIESICSTASSVLGCKAVCGAWYNPDQDTYDYALAMQGCSSYADHSARYMPHCTQSHARHDMMHHNLATGPTIVSGANMDPQQIPFNMQAGHTGQQIAIVAPVPNSVDRNGNHGSYVMPSADMNMGCSQVMYIMPPAPPCPQPGVTPETDDVPPGTPPPSYSTLELDQLCADEEAEGSHSQSSLAGSAAQSQEQLAHPSAPSSRAHSISSQSQHVLPLEQLMRQAQSTYANPASGSANVPASPPPEYSQRNIEGSTLPCRHHHSRRGSNPQQPTLLELSRHSYAAQMQGQLQHNQRPTGSASRDPGVSRELTQPLVGDRHHQHRECNLSSEHLDHPTSYTTMLWLLKS